MKWIKSKKFLTAILENGSQYEISLEQIKKDGIRKWIEHLSDKNWFDDKSRRDFVSLMLFEFQRRAARKQ